MPSVNSIQPESKKCTKCGVETLLSEFSKDSRKKSGYGSCCKKCTNKRCAAWYLSNRPELIEYRRKYNRSRTGISQEEYDWLSSVQGHCCVLCLQKSSRKLDVDHDHACHPDNYRDSCKKCIRGLLCNSCNRFFLPRMEKFPRLQNDLIKNYLRARPFMLLKRTANV